MEAIEFLEKTKNICAGFRTECPNCPLSNFCHIRFNNINMVDFKSFVDLVKNYEFKKTQEEFLEEFREKINLNSIIELFIGTSNCRVLGIECPVKYNKTEGCGSCKWEIKRYFGI